MGVRVQELIEHARDSGFLLSVTGICERIVNRWQWAFYRIQFWRFEKKFKQFDVLREKKLDAWMR